MNKFTEFFEQHEKVKTFAFNKLLNVIEKHRSPINKGSIRAKKKLYNYLRDPKNVSENLLLKAYFHIIDSEKKEATSNVVNFPSADTEGEEMVAESPASIGPTTYSEANEDEEQSQGDEEEPDPFKNPLVKGVTLDETNLTIIQAVSDRQGERIDRVTHSGLVEKLDAMADMKNRDPDYKRKPILLYGPAGIGKTEGVIGYAMKEAKQLNRLFVELPVHLLVAGQEKHQMKILTAYNDPDKKFRSQVSWNDIQEDISQYYLLVTARPSQLNPLMFGGLPGEEPVYNKLQSASVGKFTKELPNEKELKALNKKQVKNNRSGGHATHEHGDHPEKHLRTGSRTIIDVPGDFQTLIQAKDKFDGAKGTIFIDEITRIDDELFFNMLMPYLEADNMYNSGAFAMIAAGNAGKGFQGVMTVDDAAQKDRFDSILYFQYDPDEFLDYIKNGEGLHPVMEKWVYSNSVPFEAGAYNIELDEQYNGKTYAIPASQDTDTDVNQREEYEKQMWTPRRFAQINHMWHILTDEMKRMEEISDKEQNHETAGTEDWEPGVGLDDDEKSLLYSGGKRFDPKIFARMQISNILTSINIQEISEDLSKSAIDYFSHSSYGVQIKGAQSASTVAEYISDAIMSLPTSLEHIPVYYREMFDKSYTNVPLGGFFALNYTEGSTLEENPFGKFNFTDDGSDNYTSLSGLKDALSDPEQGRDTAIQLTGHINESLHEQIIKPFLGQIHHTDSDGIFSGNISTASGQSNLYINITDNMIRELFLLGHIGKKLQIAGLKLGENVEDEFSGALATMYQIIGLNTLHEWLETLIGVHETEVTSSTSTSDVMDLDLDMVHSQQQYSSGIHVSADPSNVLIQHVNVAVPPGQLNNYNPEFVAIKMVLVLIEVINSVWPGAAYGFSGDVASVLQKHNKFVTEFINGDVDRMIKNALPDASKDDALYSVVPGGTLGGLGMDELRKSSKLKSWN